MLLFKKKFPNDEVGTALSDLYKKGINFKVKHTVHFTIQLKDQESGVKLMELLKQKGFEGKLLENNKTYQIIYPKHMLLDYDELINIQKILTKMSQTFNGFGVGWELIK